MSKNTIWDRLYIKLAKLIDFDEKFKLFNPKNPTSHPRKSKIWKFWEIWAKLPFETHSMKILLISAIFKDVKQFFEITHLLSRKSRAVERFQFSWAKIVFERHSKEKYPCFAFLKTFKCFSEKNISFSKNPTFRTSSEHMSISELRYEFGKKTCEVRRFGKVWKRFFFKISIYFSEKGQNLNVLRILEH